MMIMIFKIRIDYLEIIFMLHIKMLYKMIDFMQKFEQTEWEKKTVNSMMLIKNNETQWWSEYELMLNKSVMTKFVLMNRCWWEMMSLYLDKKQTNCTTAAAAAAAAVRVKEKNMNMMLCDWCEKEIAEWQKSQTEIASEWQKVWIMLNKLMNECTACWITQNRKLTYLHDWQSCLMMTKFSETACEKF